MKRLLLLPFLLTALACRFLAPADEGPDPLLQAVEETSTALAVDPPVRPCQVPPGNPPLPPIERSGAAASDLSSFLNDGGAPEAVERQPGGEAFGAFGARLSAQADVDNDGWEDVALSLIEPPTETVPPSGTMFFFLCREGQYRLNYTTAALPEFSLPILHAAEDLTSEGGAELLTSRIRCGAHTCFQQISVFVWNGETLENRLQGQSDDLPNPTVELRDSGIAGKEIRVTGAGIASAGAGPYRPTTRVWRWDPEQRLFLVARNVQQPSTFRVHVLHDSDRAAAEGDFAAALEGYRQVIERDDLVDWVDPALERATLSAYARFRRMVISLQLGDQAGAEIEYERLRGIYVEGPGSAYREMAELFWNSYESEENLSTACEAARNFAIARAAGILEPLYFGYSNPSYGAAEICPLADE